MIRLYICDPCMAITMCSQHCAPINYFLLSSNTWKVVCCPDFKHTQSSVLMTFEITSFLFSFICNVFAGGLLNHMMLQLCLILNQPIFCSGWYVKTLVEARRIFLFLSLMLQMIHLYHQQASFFISSIASFKLQLMVDSEVNSKECHIMQTGHMIGLIHIRWYQCPVLVHLQVSIYKRVENGPKLKTLSQDFFLPISWYINYV